jgi:cardiolipin synthase
VHIHEYCRSPLHGKVAVIDDEWATVGSSNLDPISLSLNLEANVFIRDRSFARALREHLVDLMENSCEEVDTSALRSSTIWRALRSAVVFHVLRRFPGWAGLLPAHRPIITQVQADRDAGADREAGAEGER